MFNYDSDEFWGKQLKVYPDNYNEMATDELLELMPDNLHLAKNSNAPEHDRWRVFNSHTKKYVEPGFSTAKELMIHALTRIDEQRKEWMSTDVSESA